MNSVYWFVGGVLAGCIVGGIVALRMLLALMGKQASFGGRAVQPRGCLGHVAGVPATPASDPVPFPSPAIIVPVTRPGGFDDRAVLFGKNRYPGAPLAGCVNDVINMLQAILIDHFGFDRKNVILLKDEESTTAAERATLRWLAQADGTGRPRRRLLWNSGHGTTVPDPLDPAGVISVECPIDFDWSAARMNTSRDLVALLRDMPAGTPFVWGSDSCNSGALDRALRNGGPKRAPRLYPSTSAAAMDVGADVAHRLAAGGHHTRTRDMIAGHLDVAYISGCRTDQTSADTEVDGVPCGAMTAYFVRTIRDMWDAPFVDVVAATRKALANAGYEQVPQPDGPQVSRPAMAQWE